MSSREGEGRRRKLLEDNPANIFHPTLIKGDLNDSNLSFTYEGKKGAKLKIDTGESKYQLSQQSQQQQQHVKPKTNFLTNISENNNSANNISINQSEPSIGQIPPSPSINNVSRQLPHNNNDQKFQPRSIYFDVSFDECYEKKSPFLNIPQNEENQKSLFIEPPPKIELEKQHPEVDESIEKIEIQKKSPRTKIQRSDQSSKKAAVDFFRKSNIVKRFIINLLARARCYVFKNLSEHQLSTIGDIASYYPFYRDHGFILQKESLLVFLNQRASQIVQEDVLQNEKFIIAPDSLLGIIWEFISLFLWIGIVFFIPYRVTFHFSTSQPQFQAFDTLTLLFIFFETLVKLNKAVFKRGIIITNREDIFFEYIRSDALLDLFIFLSFFVSNTFNNLGFVQYVLELRLLRIIKTCRELFQQFDQSSRLAVARRITLLVLTILTFINLQGSIFVKIGIQQNHKQVSISDGDFDTYVAGLYWSTITMTTIGYGDIYPQSTLERIYVAVVSLVSCGIFGYSISQIGEIVSEIQRKSEVFNSKIQSLNRLMNSREANKKLMYQVIKYFEYLHLESQSSSEEEGREMIEELPQSMKEKIIYELNYKLFYNQKMFTLNFSRPFLDKLAIQVKQMVVGPETDIFQQGDLDGRLYFIQKGFADMYFKKNEKQITCKQLQKGDMLGDVEFFGQSERRFGVRSLSVVMLLYIDFQDFYSCLLNFQSDFESYSMIKDRLLLEGDMKPFNRRCESCGSFNHLFFNCSRLQYNPNVDKLIYKCNQSTNQKRVREHERKSFKCKNALKHHKEISTIAEDFITYNGSFIIANGDNDEQDSKAGIDEDYQPSQQMDNVDSYIDPFHQNKATRSIQEKDSPLIQTNNNTNPNNLPPVAFSNKMPSRHSTRIKVNSTKLDRQILTDISQGDFMGHRKSSGADKTLEKCSNQDNKPSDSTFLHGETILQQLLGSTNLSGQQQGSPMGLSNSQKRQQFQSRKSGSNWVSSLKKQSGNIKALSSEMQLCSPGSDIECLSHSGNEKQQQLLLSSSNNRQFIRQQIETILVPFEAFYFPNSYFLWIHGFEKAKNFAIYFYQHNLDFILAKLKAKTARRRKKKIHQNSNIEHSNQKFPKRRPFKNHSAMQSPKNNSNSNSNNMINSQNSFKEIPLLSVKQSIFLAEQN